MIVLNKLLVIKKTSAITPDCGRVEKKCDLYKTRPELKTINHGMTTLFVGYRFFEGVNYYFFKHLFASSTGNDLGDAT